MKQLLPLFVLFLLNGTVRAQDITIDWSIETGSVNGLYKQNGLTITKISAAGDVLEFLIFDSEMSLNNFLRRPNELNKPLQTVEIEGVQVYLESFSSFEYYSPNEYNAGKIKRIGDLAIGYYLPHEYNSGKIKQMGDVKFQYYTSNEYHSGRLKQIGDVAIKYYTSSEYNSGKLKQIGDLTILYYTSNEYGSGKLKQVGDIEFEYYNPNEYNSGKFKKMNGSDPRIKLI